MDPTTSVAMSMTPRRGSAAKEDFRLITQRLALL